MEFTEDALRLMGVIAAVIGVIGGVAVSRGKKETKQGEGPSQVAILKHSIDENTKANNAINEQMVANMRYLEAVSISTANIERMASDLLAISRSVDRTMIEMGATRRSGK